MFPLPSAVAVATLLPLPQGALSPHHHAGTMGPLEEEIAGVAVALHQQDETMTAGAVAEAVVVHLVQGEMMARLLPAASQVRPVAGRMGHLPLQQRPPQKGSQSLHLHLASLCHPTCATGVRRARGGVSSPNGVDSFMLISAFLTNATSSNVEVM